MRWTFGVEPLPQAVAIAPLLRDVAGLITTLEEDDPAVAELSRALLTARDRLEEVAPASPVPRIGAAAGSDGRVYLDHSPAIGSFSPAFPVYEIDVDGDLATGTVEFPLLYEGPPGVVHGGFLAVFFDCAIQHHNCDLGLAGKTTDLQLRYRRPAPLVTPLRFEIRRSVDATRITSTAQLLRDETLLCEARMGAVAGDRDALPAVDPRRAR